MLTSDDLVAVEIALGSSIVLSVAYCIGRELTLRGVRRVLREFHEDCEGDIEGCGAAELDDIESCMSAAKTIRQRIHAHFYKGADFRGQSRQPRE